MKTHPTSTSAGRLPSTLIMLLVAMSTLTPSIRADINLLGVNVNATLNSVVSADLVNTDTVTLFSGDGTGANALINLDSSGHGAGLGAIADLSVLGLASAHICLDLGINQSHSGICNLSISGDPTFYVTDPSNGDGGSIIFPELTLSHDLNAVFSALNLQSALSQPFVARQAMTTATRDIGGRLFRYRAVGPNSEETEPDPVTTSGKSPALSGKSSKSVFVPHRADPEHGIWVDVFVQGDISDYDSDAFGIINGLQSNAYAGTAGAELHVTENIMFGLAGSWVEADATLAGKFGSTDAEGFLATVYGSYSTRHYYLDLLYSVGWLDHDLDRTASDGQIARAETDSFNQVVSFNTGFNLEAGPFVTGPYLRLDYGDTDVNGYKENGHSLLKLRVDDQNYESLVSQVGWHVSVPVTTGFGSIAAQIRGAWVHEFLDDTDRVSATPVSFPANTLQIDRPELESDYGLIGAGLVFRVGKKVSFSVDYDIILASDTTIQSGTVALKINL